MSVLAGDNISAIEIRVQQSCLEISVPCLLGCDNSGVFHTLGGSSDSPCAGTREQQRDTKNFVVCWE